MNAFFLWHKVNYQTIHNTLAYIGKVIFCSAVIYLNYSLIYPLIDSFEVGVELIRLGLDNKVLMLNTYFNIKKSMKKAYHKEFWCRCSQNAREYYLELNDNDPTV